MICTSPLGCLFDEVWHSGDFLSILSEIERNYLWVFYSQNLFSELTYRYLADWMMIKMVLPAGRVCPSLAVKARDASFLLLFLCYLFPYRALWGCRCNIYRPRFRTILIITCIIPCSGLIYEHWTACMPLVRFGRNLGLPRRLPFEIYLPLNCGQHVRTLKVQSTTGSISVSNSL